MEKRYRYREMFGDINTMKVLDYFAELKADEHILNVKKGTKLDRKTIETILKPLMKSRLIINTRMVGRIIMYKRTKKLIELNDFLFKQS